MKKSKLTLISHYYNNIDSLLNQIILWNSFPHEIRECIEIVVIDDCSNNNIELDLSKLNSNLNLNIFRILDDIPWNQAGSRNLGAFLSSSPWSLFFDIDQKLTPEGINNIISNIGLFDSSCMYHFLSEGILDSNNNNNPMIYAPSTYLANTNAFKNFGMLDEDFSGNYGYEDIYLHSVWEKNGKSRLLINDCIYFVDHMSATVNLDRDLSINKNLIELKILSGTPRPKNILRFNWTRTY